MDIATAPCRDREYLDRIASRDIEAFWTLWRCHHNYLFRVALRLSSGDRHEAHDILGDACLRLVEEMPRYAASVQDSRRWIVRVVVNVAIDRMRRRKRVSTSVGSLDDVAALIDAAGKGESLTPEMETAWRESMRQTLEAMAALPPRLSSVAHLHFLQERSYAEISRELVISEALARKRIQEVRNLLRCRLRPY